MINQSMCQKTVSAITQIKALILVSVWRKRSIGASLICMVILSNLFNLLILNFYQMYTFKALMYKKYLPDLEITDFS